MKIAYITMQFPVPSETFASLDVNVLSELGHDVSVYALRTPHPDYQRMALQRHHKKLFIRHFSWRFSLHALWAILLQPLATLDLMWWIIKNCLNKPAHLVKSFMLLPVIMWHFKALRYQSFDVVHLFWGHYPSMLGFLVRNHLEGVKVTQFLGAHDLIVNYPGSLGLAKQISNVITHCHANIDSLIRLGIERAKISVIHRGVDTTKSTKSTDKFEGLDKPLFLTAGRLIDNKGVDDVIDIFQRVLDKYPKAKLVIAGDGPSRRGLEHKVSRAGLSSRITFIGHVYQEQLFEEMNRTHFFLLMSRYASERLPNVIKEAMLRKCLVITTRTPGIEELINHEKTGFIVPISDSSSTVAYRAIDLCMQNETQTREMALHAARTITESFDVRASMQQYLRIWQQ